MQFQTTANVERFVWEWIIYPVGKFTKNTTTVSLLDLGYLETATFWFYCKKYGNETVQLAVTDYGTYKFTTMPKQYAPGTAPPVTNTTNSTKPTVNVTTSRYCAYYGYNISTSMACPNSTTYTYNYYYGSSYYYSYNYYYYSYNYYSYYTPSYYNYSSSYYYSYNYYDSDDSPVMSTT
jgi:hypothetical protein